MDEIFDFEKDFLVYEIKKDMAFFKLIMRLREINKDIEALDFVDFENLGKEWT